MSIQTKRATIRTSIAIKLLYVEKDFMIRHRFDDATNPKIIIPLTIQITILGETEFKKKSAKELEELYKKRGQL